MKKKTVKKPIRKQSITQKLKTFIKGDELLIIEKFLFDNNLIETDLLKDAESDKKLKKQLIRLYQKQILYATTDINGEMKNNADFMEKYLKDAKNNLFYLQKEKAHKEPSVIPEEDYIIEEVEDDKED